MVKSTKNSSIFLGNKVIVIYLSAIFVFISCVSNNQIVPQAKVTEEKQVSYSSPINGFLLKLEKNSEGKCTLSYKKESEKNSQEKTITLDMDAPCEFVRLPNSKIRVYGYGKKDPKYYGVIIPN